MTALPSRRKTLRTGIQTLLQNNIPALANRVTTNQYAPLDPAALPIVVITTPSTQRENDNPQEINLTTDLRIVIFAAETDANPVDDTLDHLSEAIETILLAQPQTLGGLLYHITPGPQLTTIDETNAENIYGIAVDEYTLHTLLPKPPVLTPQE